MIQVFVENEKGSYEKKCYNESTLEHMNTHKLPLPYPYPYGFILDTMGDDGEHLDSYIITQDPLKSGMVVSCEPFAMLEFIEDDEIDHKIFTTICGQSISIDQNLKEIFKNFLYGIFAEEKDMTVKVGDILTKEAAIAFIQKYSTRSP